MASRLSVRDIWYGRMVSAMPMPKKYLGLDSKRDSLMPDPLDNVR